MGHVHTLTPARASQRPRRTPGARVLDVLAGTLLLVLALPLMAVFALAVRRGSNGPVLHRERSFDGRGEAVELLSFRTTLDGGGTASHERLRAVIGAGAKLPVTRVGRLLRRTGFERLPRLFNLVAGHVSLF